MKTKDLAKVTVIMRGYSYQQVNAICKVLVGTAFNTIEITTNSPNAFDTVKRIKEEYAEKIYVGVGTVLTMEHAISAVESNADFILSPIALGKDIIDFCKKNNVLTVPAAMTPTEIYELIQNGADVVKVFPAKHLQISYAKDIQAPLGKLPLMAVGGININNVNDYFENNYQYVGISSGMFEKTDIESMDINKLKESLAKWESVLG